MIHADHVIPWSYIYEDEIWNLVLSCRKCNLKKHSSLPHDRFIELLVERNMDYKDDIEPLKISLFKLDSENNYKNAIGKHYQNCIDYGFTIISF